MNICSLFEPSLDFNRDDQYHHERMKRWMSDHNWSTSSILSPEDILILIEEQGEEANFNNIQTIDL